LLSDEEPVLDDASALAFHWQELAECNDAQNAAWIAYQRPLTQQEVPNLPANCHKEVLLGAQLAPKYNKRERVQVNILLALIRLPQVHTDILISLNELLPASPLSSGQLDPSPISEASTTAFFAFISNLRIQDWGLFNA